MTRVAFLGTPAAAVPALEAVASEYEIAAVVTQPDRPKGRSREPVPTPVKVAALRLSLPVVQPESSAEIEDSLGSAGPLDVGIVVAYGHILRREVLVIPSHGFLNVHFSLLPRWRGAAPVKRALMAGDPMTGVTIIRLDEGLDTGPVLTAQAIDIPRDDDAGELTARLADLGARLLVEALPRYLEGQLEVLEQSNEGASYAEKITADDRPIDIGGTAVDFVNRVRGLSPEPGATLVIDGDRHKIFRASLADSAPEPGTWEANEGVPVVGVSDGGVALIELQAPGKTRQAGEAWLRGRHRSGGSVE